MIPAPRKEEARVEGRSQENPIYPQCQDEATRAPRPKRSANPDASFVQEKLDWYDQVRWDRLNKATTVVVALAIGQRMNSRERYTWPKQQTLAKDCGLAVRTVRDEIKRLIANGHLRKVKRGRGNLNAYAWILRPE